MKTNFQVELLFTLMINCQAGQIENPSIIEILTIEIATCNNNNNNINNNNDNNNNNNNNNNYNNNNKPNLKTDFITSFETMIIKLKSMKKYVKSMKKKYSWQISI